MIEKFKNKLNADANLKEFLSGSAVTFVIKITGMFLSYLVLLIVSRSYGAEGTGVYSLTLRLLSSIGILGCLGLDVSVLRYVGQFGNHTDSHARLKQLFKHFVGLAFPFSILLGSILYIFANEIAVNLFENDIYSPALKISAFTLPFFTLNLVNVEFIRGLKLLKVSEYLRSINRQLIIVILLTLPVFSFGMLNAIYALAAGLLVTFVLSFGYIFRYFKKQKPKKLAHKGLNMKELLATSTPMMITSLASFALVNAAPFFLEVFSDSDQVGVFNVCLMLAQLVSLVLVVVNTIAGPKFAELYWAGKIRELKKIIHQSTKLIFLASLLISLFLILFSKFFLGIFGPEFKEGTLVMVILVLGQMVNATTGSVSLFLNMSGNQKKLRNIIVVTAVIVLFGYYFFIPYYGILGAAVIYMIGMLVLNVTASVVAYKKHDIKTFYIPFARFKQ